jgi:CheY-like chemotaxis protein
MEAVGRLAGGVAHDFNNILGMILGFAELARDGTGSAASRAQDLDEIIRAAERGKELVQQILRFSRRQEMSRVPINLAESIPEVLRLLRATLPAGLEIRQHVTPGLPLVAGDPTSLQQVLMNLATNAAHAMPAGGLLEITLEPFYARDSFVRAHPGLREGAFVRLAVRDNGSGMDEATRAQAFEPFFTTKPAGSGTGLGLSMVHGIIHEFGGTVWLESAPGSGTTVTCLLPVLEQEDRTLPDGREAPSPPSATPRATVLYVDDEASLLTIGDRRLTAAGYRVVGASNPAEALERFGQDPDAIDLVITDFSMPRLNGMELALALTRIRPNLPILLLTGYMQEFSPAELAAAGVQRVLNKPVPAMALLEAIDSVLEQR